MGIEDLFVGEVQVLTVSDITRILGISRQETYALIHSGAIPAFKLGSTWRIIRDDLIARLKEQENLP